MTKPTDIGMNRTGIGTSPIEARNTEEGALEGMPSSDGDERTGDVARAPYLKRGLPIGTMPLPATVKGALKTVGKMLRGEKAAVLLDKLGERLAFERTGTRLYEAFLSKLDALPKRPDVPPRQEVLEIHAEELRHFHMLRHALATLGGDPTVTTPSADVTGVASLGLVQVISDPRTSIGQSLQALLIAELTDNDGWATLVELTEAMGHEELAAEFRTAQLDELKHLMRVRAWCSSLLGEDAGVMLPIGDDDEDVTPSELIAIGQELVEEGVTRLPEE
jgi:hypothetical protein